MGKVYQFRKPRRAPPLKRVKWKPKPQKPKSFWTRGNLLTIALGLFLGGMISLAAIKFMAFKEAEAKAAPGEFACAMPLVVDGDTLRCGSTRIRLEGIDAPEMPGHCRPGRDCAPGDPYDSKRNLARLVAWNPIICRKVDTDHYGRTIAFCRTEKFDLSCQQLRDGQAIRRYGSIPC